MNNMEYTYTLVVTNSQTGEQICQVSSTYEEGLLYEMHKIDPAIEDYERFIRAESDTEEETN